MHIDSPIDSTPLAASRLTAKRLLLRDMIIGCMLAGSCIDIVSAQTLFAPAAAEIGVDTSVKPGDDFFAYANGEWLKNTNLPASKARLTAGAEITEATRRQVMQLLDETAAAPPGSIARKVADFRKAWLGAGDGIQVNEQRAKAQLKNLFDRIERIGNKVALARHLGAGLRADVDPMNVGIYRSSHVLGLATQASIHGENKYAAFLVQGGIGLPSRDYYFSGEAGMAATRERYQHAVARALELTGVAPTVSARRAADVLALETAIARSHATPDVSGREKNADNLWTQADFARRAPGLEWSSFFAAAGLARQRDFVAWQPSAITGLAALTAATPLQVWKDYLRVRVIGDYADAMPREYADLAPALQGAAPDRVAAPRLQRATEATEAAMGDAIGQLYAERHFPPAYKARVQAIAADVRSAFISRIKATTWFSPQSKATAMEKLKAIYFGVGYPETWRDYTDLTVDATDLVGNMQRIAARNYRLTLARLGRPVDRREWSVSPRWAGGNLMFQMNAYNFTAALLQVPKFDPAASDASNYGAIGAIFGHEICHFVDVLGAEYEPNGRARRWWTAEDTTKYDDAAIALVKQFSQYQPLPGAHIDGKLTLTENIADLAGLSAAFAAHRAALGTRLTDKGFVRQQDREFFIGFARGWRSKYTEAGLKKQLADDHAPEAYRIATVRNIDAWYEAFDVQPGQRLYLDPSARVRIW